MSELATPIRPEPVACAPASVCDHCGLPVPPGLVRPEEDRQFCCNGCRTVFEILHANGLDGYYGLLEAAGAERPTRPSGRGYEELDDPKFRELYTRGEPGGFRSVELYLEGVRCGACVWLVEKLPELVPGVAEARLDLRKSLVRVSWDDRIVPLSAIGRALDSLGYPAHPAKDARTRELRRREDRRFLIRLGVAGALAGNVMALSFALYGGSFGGIEEAYSRLFRVASLLLGLISIAWPGRVFFQGAWAALRTRTPHLDLPIALGLGVGTLAGVVNTIAGRGEIYFDSITVLVFLLLVGRFIQHRQQRWASDALELLFSLTPGTARRIGDDGAQTVPIESLGIGERVEVAAGDTVPVDGRVEEGTSSLDVAALTGESRPVAAGPGDAVRAGSINLSARLEVRVEATGADTRVGRLMQAVEEHVRRKAPIVQLADRIAGWFVVGVILLASVTLIAWWSTGPSQAIEHATALLIVTCPCALGLATPLAIAVAVGRAAKRGIFVKGGDALERLARGGTLLLDKTGTITEGRVALVRWEGDDRARPWVAALEAHSSHPIARGLVSALGDRSDLETEAVEQVAGKGMRGSVAGREIVVGSPAFVRAELGGLGEEFERRVGASTRDALTPVVVAVDGRPVAVAALGDPVRPDAAAAIVRLRDLGFRVGILSGDHPAVVSAVGRRIGLGEEDGVGSASPERKLESVQEAAKRGPVVMVGDGVNDAAALAAASVGVAVQGGTEASVSAADVYLGRPGLAPVVEAVVGGRRAMRAIRAGLVVSLLYNTVAASLAVAGVIHPWIAAILMPASSLSVLGIALGSRTFGGD